MKTQFEDIVRVSGSGSVFEKSVGKTADNTAETFSIHDVIFTNCEVTGNGKHGGAVSVTFSDAQGILDIHDVTFDGCESTAGNGGALYIDSTTAGSISVVDVIFNACKVSGTAGTVVSKEYSSGAGGGIYIKLGSNLPSFTWAYVQFTGTF